MIYRLYTVIRGSYIDTTSLGHTRGCLDQFWETLIFSTGHIAGRIIKVGFLLMIPRVVLLKFLD